MFRKDRETDLNYVQIYNSLKNALGDLSRKKIKVVNCILTDCSTSLPDTAVVFRLILKQIFDRHI